MRRIAIALLCMGFYAGNAPAAPCDVVGDVVGGFAAGATSYGMARNLGPPASWVSAGLYGAGITVATLGGREAGRESCENFSDVLYTIANIYCIAGEYICDDIDDLTRSFFRDFQVCASCSVDDVVSAFFMADDVRKAYLEWLQSHRHDFSVTATLDVLPRDRFGPMSSTVLNSYYTGQQAGFALLRMRSLSFMPN